MDELDKVVNEGLFRNRTEAVNEGIRLLVRRYSAIKIGERIERLSEKGVGKPSVTEALFEARKEDD
ncbi:MAG: hypothetical protein GF334_08910 [Candidatus Altiarchaeales archaeon]|nr:hypothetical protein [Candidatus Altiarchaeales archaeon]